MMRVAAALLALLAGYPAYGQAPEETLIGAYEVRLGKADNGLLMRLECESAEHCVLSTAAVSVGREPVRERKELNEVKPADHLWEAANALRYATDQREKKIENPEYADMMERLRPVLDAKPTLSKCWDLGYGQADYMLVCTLKGAPPGSDPLYLFGSLLATCGEAFCRFVIVPMARAN